MRKEIKTSKLEIYFPVNYDFGKNWKTKIVPLLETPEVLKAIRKGVNDYLKNFPGNKKYKKDTAPASYSSMDCYHDIMNDKLNKLEERLEKKNKLPASFVKANKAFCDAEDGAGKYMSEEEYEKIQIDMHNEYDKLQSKYFCWEKIKYSVESYILYGACHWWAPTFCLTLAKLVQPDEKWKIRKGETHTTVINKDETKIFDLVFWYIHLDKNDGTLGGREAFIESSYHSKL